MSMKSMIKQNVKEGDKIQIHHLNGKEYEGVVINMDATNPSDFSIVLEDDDGDRYIMNIGASMGVIMINSKPGKGKGKTNDEEKFIDVHSPKKN